MKKKLLFFILSVFFLMTATSMNGQVRITEVMSNSGTGGTADWFEVTNFGNAAVDITGWKVDDSSFLLSAALALNGVTSIPAGKSVIFTESAAPATDIPAFKTFWGTSLDAVSVGSYTGSGIGLSSSGDGIVLFDSTGTLLSATQLSFPASAAGSSFYWTYDATGAMLSAATGVVSTVGTISGTASNQVTLTSANVLANIGSPGSAVVPTALGVTDFKNAGTPTWRVQGKMLLFDEMPESSIEIYAITGSKVFTHKSAKEINLDLSKGIYIIRVNNKSGKILIQ